LCALIIALVAWQTYSLRKKLDGPLEVSEEDMAEAMRIYAKMKDQKEQ